MMHVHAWRPAVLAALIPALAFSAAPAFAQSAAPNSFGDPEVRQMTVNYGDLDLTGKKGRQMLEMRLRRTAETVCAYDPSDRLQFGHTDERTCYDAAMAHAHVSLATAITKVRMANRQ